MAANRANIGWYLDNQIGGEDDRITGRVYEKTVKLTSAELLALRAAPKELVAAPGLGQVLQFVSAVGFLDYNSAVYANNGELTIRYTDNSGTAVSDAVANTALFHQGDDCYEEFGKVDPDAELELTVNAALVLSEGTGEAITGDSPMTIKIFYRILDFN